MNEAVKDIINALSECEMTTVIDYDWETGILVLNYGGAEDNVPETMDDDTIAILVYTRVCESNFCWDDNKWNLVLIQNELYVSVGYASDEFECFFNILKALEDNKESYPDSDHITDEMLEKRANLRKVMDELSKGGNQNERNESI